MSSTTENPNIAKETVILSLEIGRISNNRTLPKDTKLVTSEVDRKMLCVSVNLYNSDELKAVNSYLNKVSRIVKAMSVPSFFRGGMYLVKHEAFTTIDDYLEESEKELQPTLDAFIAVSEAAKEDARGRLGGAFNENWYPSPDRIREVFRLEWRWLVLATPDALADLDAAKWKREVEKGEESIKKAVANIEALLAAEAKGLADHMVERLTPDVDGKSKKFHKTLVSNMAEFLRNFNLRSIGTSTELDAEVERMRGLLNGVDPKTLRDDATLRKDLATKFSTVAVALDGLVVKPKRFINLKEVEPQ